MGKDSIVQVLMFQNYNFYKIATDSNYLIKLNIIIFGLPFAFAKFQDFSLSILCSYQAIFLFAQL